MMTEPVSGKVAVMIAAAVTPAVAKMPFDMWWLLFVPVGLMLGWSGRVAKLVQRRADWAEIKRDLIVSLLAGGLNALLASALIIWLKLDYVGGVFCAALCGFEGVRAFETAIEWARNHLINDAAVLAQRRQEAQLMSAENAERDLERMARKISEKPDES